MLMLLLKIKIAIFSLFHMNQKKNVLKERRKEGEEEAFKDMLLSWLNERIFHSILIPMVPIVVKDQCFCIREILLSLGHAKIKNLSLQDDGCPFNIH